MSAHTIDAVKDVVIGTTAVAASFVAFDDAISALTMFTLVFTAILLPMRAVKVIVELLDWWKARKGGSDG